MIIFYTSYKISITIVLNVVRMNYVLIFNLETSQTPGLDNILYYCTKGCPNVRLKLVRPRWLCSVYIGNRVEILG